MKIDLIEYIPETDNQFTAGYAKVCIADKLNIIAKVCKSKAGNLYVAYQNIKVNSLWVESFGLADENINNKMKNQILELVKPIAKQYEDKATQQYNAFEISEEDVPF